MQPHLGIVPVRLMEALPELAGTGAHLGDGSLRLTQQKDLRYQALGGVMGHHGIESAQGGFQGADILDPCLQLAARRGNPLHPLQHVGLGGSFVADVHVHHHRG